MRAQATSSPYNASSSAVTNNASSNSPNPPKNDVEGTANVAKTINIENPSSIAASSSEIRATPKISIHQRTSHPSLTPQQRAKPGIRDNLEVWEDRTLGGIFKITVHSNEEYEGRERSFKFLPGVKKDLEEDGSHVRLSTTVLDQAILEAASNYSSEKPLDYLLGCWKRVSKLFRSPKAPGADDPKYAIIKEARRLCMSYCIFAVTMPEMFGAEPYEENPLVGHLLLDPESDTGICQDFFSEAVARFKEDDSIKEVLIGAIEQLSRRLSRLSMNDDYKPYMLVSFIGLEMYFLAKKEERLYVNLHNMRL